MVSSCEVVNCTSVQIQCTGSAPTISVEKTDGCVLYMPQSALQTSQLTTAKISEMNVVVMGVEGEPQECAIPEQFVSKYRDGKMVTEAVTHSG